MTGKTIRRTAVLVLLATALTGCAALIADPVPPPPPAPTAYGENPERWLVRGEEGTVDFVPLKRAREAISEAAAVAESSEPLARARAALSRADAAWNEIAADPLADLSALAEAEYHAYVARRWSETAVAEAAYDDAQRELRSMQAGSAP